MTVAETILEQLGGKKFIVMTGSSNFIDTGTGLKMKLAKNSSKANYLWITLNGKDLYDINFYRYTAPKFNMKTGTISGDTMSCITEVNDVFCENLRDVFESTTGLYTSL